MDHERPSPSHQGAEEPSTSGRTWDPLSTIKAKMCKSKHDDAILALAGPAVIALAADPLLSVVDTGFVGHIGPDELAALGVNTALFSFAFVVFNFLATATTPSIAKAVAQGDREGAGRQVWQAGVVALVLGLGVGAGLVAFADPALSWMGADSSPHVHELAHEYLVWRALAAPAALLLTASQGAFRGLQDMKTVLNITVFANMINLALDPLLIFGLHQGVAGAAAATTGEAPGSGITAGLDVARA